MRGRQILVAGRKVDLVPHRFMGVLVWDAFLAAEEGPQYLGDCLTLGSAHRTRRDLVAWLRTPAAEEIVRQA